MRQAKEELVELSNGCICCTLRADLLREVTRLAKLGTFDYLLIESTGVSEPMQVILTTEMAITPNKNCGRAVTASQVILGLMIRLVTLHISI